MAAAVARHVGARHVVITDMNPRAGLAAQVADVHPVNVAQEDLKDVMSRLHMVQGFDVGSRCRAPSRRSTRWSSPSSWAAASPSSASRPARARSTGAASSSRPITIKGVYGREIFETWYKMIAMLENGLDVRRVITHRFKAADYRDGFEAMLSGQSARSSSTGPDALPGDPRRPLLRRPEIQLRA
jgi:threonine 3-dehydrogenase